MPFVLLPAVIPFVLLPAVAFALSRTIYG